MTKGKDVTNIGWNLDNSYSKLPKLFYTRQNPVAVVAPELVIFNHSLATDLGLDAKALHSKDGVAMLAGNQLPEGSEPIAQAYAGHQFGHFTMLGDGRAILIGEQLTPLGNRFDIQWKGSGKTPYSRGGDGRAALGPMLREYILSEAMHALGIETTRSLAVITTGESVIRETDLAGAILTRVAASHVRVGTFQYAANWCTSKELRLLADYALTRHFSDLDLADADNYLMLLQEVIRRQAALVAKWQLVGFIHGVMNTDNMTISGETIDYGPCAFMDEYDPATVFSSIDTHGRYAYGNQPQIAGWNLARFAETLLPLLHDDQEEAVKLAQEAISGYAPLFQTNWLAGMRAKLGIFNAEHEDESLIASLLSMMQTHHADYTNTFLALTWNGTKDTALFSSDAFAIWHQCWQERRGRQPQSMEESQQLMQTSNPALIPRNHRVEAALEAAVMQADLSVMERLLDALAKPYAHTPKQAEYATLPVSPNRCYQTFCGT